LALIVRYILEFKLKKLLLIILLLSQPIYAHGLPQEAIEREIAEFEAELAALLAQEAIEKQNK
jgi:hypothetical protein